VRPGRWMRTLRREEGQVLAPLMLLVVVIVATGIALLQIGRASAFRAEASTGADAAALAAARNVQQQLVAQLTTTGQMQPEAVNRLLVNAAAASWARRNNSQLTRPVSYDPNDLSVRVWVRSSDGLAGPDDLDGMDGDLNDELRRQGARNATAQARAQVELTFNFPAFGAASVGGGGGSLPEGEQSKIEDDAGAPVRADSSLHGGADCDNPPDVRNLSHAMKVAIAKAEAALDAPLQINSGFRDPRRPECHPTSGVGGMVAPPGASLHNYGNAVDVQNHAALAAVLGSNPGIGLCQPFPADYVHFSLTGHRECGSRTGPAGPGGGFPDLGSFVTFDIRLVRWEG
jgi:hypothetical protein